MIPAAPAFTFDEERHEYRDAGGELRPSITQMLEREGLTDSTWMTEAGRIRGRAVHKMTADHDLGVLDLEKIDGAYLLYVLAYVKAISIMRPEILAIEVARMHSRYRYGGRADRVIRYNGLHSVMDLKSGQAEKAHAVQTALQAILEAEALELTPESMGRFCLYLKKDGRFALEEYHRRRDFDTAYRIIREQC